ncbi:MAG: VWA domain-containing protein [Rhodospirillales bacterium]|nr:VWA domain-containing protein [Rhodospirillales bacterium]
MCQTLAAFHGFLHRILHKVRPLLGDRRGAVTVFVAFAIVPLIGFVGIGTDSARAFMVKSRLSSAVDAAGLAGGRAFFTDTRDDDIVMFFNANFPPGYMGATVNGPNFTIDEDSETIAITASATVPTAFMRLFGFEAITVSAFAEITRQMEMLDVVLAIDMSGSMASSSGSGTSRITAARDAANILVDILFGNEGTKDLLQIGLVPWNGKVNITLNGTVFDDTATMPQAVAGFTNPETGAAQSDIFYVNNSPVPLLAAPPVNWQGCVFSRFIDDGDPASDADVLFGPALLTGADWPAWQPIGPEGEPVPGSDRCTLAVGGSECRRCLDHGITPLQNTKQTIVDAIDDLQNPTGTTNIPQGLGWAWRVLMPDDPFTEADPAPEIPRQQAIVLLTDGENYGGSGDGYKTTFGLGSTARPDMDARLLELAGNIKADGVILYIIQFANDGTALQTLLQQAASGPDSPFYHYAPDGDALEAVFHEIANHLSELRLSK